MTKDVKNEKYTLEGIPVVSSERLNTFEMDVRRNIGRALFEERDWIEEQLEGISGENPMVRKYIIGEMINIPKDCLQKEREMVDKAVSLINLYNLLKSQGETNLFEDLLR